MVDKKQVDLIPEDPDDFALTGGVIEGLTYEQEEAERKLAIEKKGQEEAPELFTSISEKPSKYQTRAEKLIKELSSIADKLIPAKIDSPEDLNTYLIAKNVASKIENFIVVYLDSRNQILGSEICSSGTVNKAIVYPREVLKRCLKMNATGVILAHNHPSGEVEPSCNDIHLTGLISKACDSLDIKLLDHIITSNRSEKIFSFAQENIL
jgi:DNA repair protein RadC